MLKFDGFHKAFMGVAEVWVPTGAGFGREGCV